MPCNSGVGLIPVVGDRTERFAVRGLYNGLALLADDTTNSYWDHITGACVHGPLQGMQLAASPYELRYTTAQGALHSAPDTRLAFSPGMTLRGRFLQAITPIMHRVMGNRLPSRFVRTLGEEDTRRERMDIGLGLWTASTRRYYPLSLLRAAPDGILDQVDGEGVFVYYDHVARAPDAIYVAASSSAEHEGGHAFDDGVTLRHGRLYSADGQPLPTRRPQQMLTRWYGFALTFPGCEIVAPSPRPAGAGSAPPGAR